MGAVEIGAVEQFVEPFVQGLERWNMFQGIVNRRVLSRA